jgi:hypothetical protein
LLAVEGALYLLPCGNFHATVGLLQPRKRGESLPCMLNEALPHLLRQYPPSCHKSRWILQVACPKLVVYDAGQNVSQLGEAPGSCQLRDRPAKLPSWSAFRGHVHEVVFQAPDVDVIH